MVAISVEQRVVFSFHHRDAQPNLARVRVVEQPRADVVRVGDFALVDAVLKEQHRIHFLLTDCGKLSLLHRHRKLGVLQRGGVHLVEVVADGESEKCTIPFVVPSNQVSSRRITTGLGHSITQCYKCGVRFYSGSQNTTNLLCDYFSSCVANITLTILLDACFQWRRPLRCSPISSTYC